MYDFKKINQNEMIHLWKDNKIIATLKNGYYTINKYGVLTLYNYEKIFICEFACYSYDKMEIID